MQLTLVLVADPVTLPEIDSTSTYNRALNVSHPSVNVIAIVVVIVFAMLVVPVVRVVASAVRAGATFRNRAVMARSLTLSRA